MKAGEIVTYAPGGPLGHVLGGCPGLVIETGEGFAVVEFGAILEPCPLDCLSPARLWWRKGAGDWQGPYDAWGEALALILPAGLESGLSDANGAEIISGGWRYRLAWGGEEPPERYG